MGSWKSKMVDFDRVIIVNKDTPSDVISQLHDQLDELREEYDDLVTTASRQATQYEAQINALETSIADRIEDAKTDRENEVWKELRPLVEKAFLIMGEDVHNKMRLFSFDDAYSLANNLEVFVDDQSEELKKCENRIEALEEEVQNLEYDLSEKSKDATIAMVDTLLEQRDILMETVNRLELEALGQLVIPEIATSLNFANGKVPPPVLAFIEASTSWERVAHDSLPDILSGNIPEDPLAAASVLGSRLGVLIPSMGLLSEGRKQLTVLISNLLSVIERMAASYGGR